MLMELEDGGTGFQPVRSYTWGLDLAGQSGVASGGPAGRLDGLEAAGSIGGLLAVHDETVGETGADYIYTYDANGNVGQVINLSAASAAASIVAKYEYDPYGNVTAQSGDYAETNPFRFSTKYWDDETGLGYWGLRYYSSILGRWVSRDPIADEGGDNLYGFVHGDPVNGIDPLGRCVLGNGEPCNELPPLVGWPQPPSGALCPKAGGPSSQPVSSTGGTGGPPPKIPPCKQDQCDNFDKNRPRNYENMAGVTLCDQTNPGGRCYCTFPGKAGLPGPNAGAADTIIMDCIARHEQSHGDNTECPTEPNVDPNNPWYPAQPTITGPAHVQHGESVDCLGENAARCVDNLKCLEELERRVKENADRCRATAKDQPAKAECDAKEKRALERIDQQRRAGARLRNLRGIH
jgi:RHS repeat-associated protein